MNYKYKNMKLISVFILIHKLIRIDSEIFNRLKADLASKCIRIHRLISNMRMF